MKTIKKNGYNLHIIPNSNFKTISMKIMFWNKLKKEDLVYRNLLLDNLLFSSKKYSTLKDINTKKQDLYNIHLFFDTYRKGSMIISEISMSTIEDKYSEEGNVLKSIEFLFECLNNPNVKNNSFDKTGFNICKESLKADIKNELENPDFIAYKEFKTLIGSKDVFSGSIYGDLKSLEKVTTKSLYSYYKNFFKNNHIDIFITGNITEKEIEKEFDKYLNLKSNNLKYETPSIAYNKDYSEKVKSYSYAQSKLLMGAALDNLNKDQKLYVAPIYNIILGASPSSKLFQTVREKKSYCYSISSSYSRLDNLLIIRSGISSQSYNNTKAEVLNQIESMKKGNFTYKDIKQAKELLLSILKQVNDSQWSIIDSNINNVYFGREDIDIQKEKIKNVTKEDIIKVAQKLNIDTVFLLKGDKDEEN